jgi:hypothetical protein
LTKTIIIYRHGTIFLDGPFGLGCLKDGKLRFVKNLSTAWKGMNIIATGPSNPKYVLQHGIKHVSMYLEDYHIPPRAEAYMLTDRPNSNNPIQVELYVWPPPIASDGPSSRTMPKNVATSTESLLGSTGGASG